MRASAVLLLRSTNGVAALTNVVSELYARLSEGHPANLAMPIIVPH